MEPLIFVRRGKASATSSYVAEIEKYCQANGVKEYDLSEYIIQPSDISIKMYRCALELRRANIWSISSPCLVWGYPGADPDHFGYQHEAWSPMATQLLDWSSTRYQAQFIEPTFPEDNINISDAFDDLLHQSALLRRDLRPGLTPNVDETVHNLAGGQDKGVALVGDQHNHREGMSFPQPFLALKNSSLYLHKAMRELPGGLPWCFNSGDIHARIILDWLQFEGVKAFVALGTKADAWLRSQGVTAWSKVYHPSYAKRFNVGLNSYTQQLIKAVEDAKTAY